MCNRFGVVLLNRYPYSMGALMGAPVEHHATIDQVDDEVLLELMQLVRCGKRVLGIALKPHGFNIGINEGVDAGAGLNDHLHIIPRWRGDTNFMTTTAETRVLSEDISHIYERLRRVLDTTFGMA